MLATMKEMEAGGCTFWHLEFGNCFLSLMGFDFRTGTAFSINNPALFT
jgi:hypothetical protein